MITYKEVKAEGTTPAFDCIVESDFHPQHIGSLFQNEDGYYFFQANMMNRALTQATIKDLSFKLHALNANLDLK